MLLLLASGHLSFGPEAAGNGVASANKEKARGLSARAE